MVCRFDYLLVPVGAVSLAHLALVSFDELKLSLMVIVLIGQPHRLLVNTVFDCVDSGDNLTVGAP